MRGSRVIGTYCLVVLLMSVCIYRVYYINMSDYLAAAAGVQGTYSLEVATSRGMIYDRDMRGLVNGDFRYVASVMPTPQAAGVLLEGLEGEERTALAERLSAGMPFVTELEHANFYAKGVDIFKVPIRYGDKQLAPHVVGYLSGDGLSGVSGIERAFDAELAAAGVEIRMSYQADAAGQVMQGAGFGIQRTGEEEGVGGVVLTLDADIQGLAQNALSRGCERGGVVVMDVTTGDILAMASLPAFDPRDIAASLESEDAPFINRAVSGYNIGSVFKLVVAGAALESGISTAYEHECLGYIDVNGQIFRCNNNAVHGAVDMDRALQVSCNTYFISLAQEMDPQFLLALSGNLGLGSAQELAEGIATQPGNLPGLTELQSPAAYANFSFGQGSSLASPLQMAVVVATYCNDGMGVTPRLVRGITEDGLTLSRQMPIYSHNQIVSPQTARIMQQLMVDVVEEGSGRTARPIQGGAGGKTSSAQTGIYEDDEEIVHAWFAGFYPAEQPQYSIVVFVEGGESGEDVAAPIFKRIVDGIGGLNY